MTDILAHLDAMLALAEMATTPGKWCGVNVVATELIAAARTDWPKCVKALKVAIEGLGKWCECDGVGECGCCQLKVEIEAILQGD